jgi:hypothetical protein
MGYTTDFNGSFKLNKKLDAETQTFLTKFNETRRMKRKTSKEFGVEGEFYVDGGGHAGQAQEPNIMAYNDPPSTQPSLWCQWRPNDEGTAIVWDEGEKFYSYVEWLQYLVTQILAPRGYSITGDVSWTGEDSSDIGVISVKDNVIKTYVGMHKAPQDKTVSLEGNVEFDTCIHPNNGRKYVDAKSFRQAVTRMKKAGLGIEHVIAALKITEKNV